MHANSLWGGIETYHEFGKSVDRKDGIAELDRRRTKPMGHARVSQGLSNLRARQLWKYI